MRSFFLLIVSWLKKLFGITTGQTDSDNPVTDPTGTDDPVTPKPDDPGFERPGPNPGEVVCYYGCPNSKKAQKLQLGKQIYR